MKRKKRILIVDDDQDLCGLLSRYLDGKGYQTESYYSGSEALNILKKEKYHLVLIDYRLPDGTGNDLLKKIKVVAPKTRAIIITAYSNLKQAIIAIKLGAYDYVVKPIIPDEFLKTIEAALENAGIGFPEDTSHFDDLVEKSNYVLGQSKSALKIREMVDMVAPTDFTVLIQGETGTGKEFIAMGLHKKSKRISRPMVAVDCGALSENLSSSELFGHVKGAFTGAIRSKEGSFERADGGTLFLDEIGNLSYANQMKMLRVLQEKVVNRVGSEKDIPVDVRLIVATNEDLKEKVEKGEFRKDLYYRLNEFTIDLPPLKNRKEDITEYCDLFLKKANKRLNKDVKKIKPEALSAISTYEWPGNLRELQNTINRMVLLAESDELGLMDLPQKISLRVEKFKMSAEEENLLKSAAAIAERNVILKILEETGHNKEKAAKKLKINRKTLYNKIKEYRIEDH